MLMFIIFVIRKTSVSNVGAEGEEIARHNPVKTLECEFNETGRPRETDTVMGIMYGTPGEGTSTVTDPTIQFLHKLWQSSQELAREITKLQ